MDLSNIPEIFIVIVSREETVGIVATCLKQFKQTLCCRYPGAGHLSSPVEFRYRG